MEIKFDVVKPNLLVEKNNIYINVPREQLVPFARDVDEVVARNIGALHVRESDVGAVTDDQKKKRSKEKVPLSDYLAVLGDLGQRKSLSIPSYVLLGAGDYLIDAWTLEKSKDVDPAEIKQTRGFLKNLGDHVKYIGKSFGVPIDEEVAKKHLKERLSKLEEGLAERFADLWVISGLAPIKFLESFYDNTIVVGRVILGSRTENDETVAKTREELVEKLKAYDGIRLSLATPLLMDEAYKVHLDGHSLMADYGDVLYHEWRKKLIMLDS